MSICLTMIVKNEAHILEKTFSIILSQIPISYWVIDDTGSTDGTVEFINNFFKSRNIPGELYQTEWRDFGYNRTKAFEHAYNKSDYALVWDADDYISGTIQLPEKLTADSYILQFGYNNGCRHYRPQLFNNRKKWKYVGVMHEYSMCLEKCSPAETIYGDYYIVNTTEGARSKDPNKYLKDALILEQALLEDPQNARHVFYCGNSYKDAKMPEKAIEQYKRLLTMSCWSEEKYIACIRIYDLCNSNDNLHYLVESYKYSPDRVEGIYGLIKHYCGNGMNQIAMTYYSLIRDYYENRYINDNWAGKLFIQTEIYSFYLPYCMIIVSLKLNNQELAMKMFEMIFTCKYVNSTKWFIDNMFYNLQFLKIKTDKTFIEKLETYYNLLTVEIGETQKQIINKFIGTV